MKNTFRGQGDTLAKNDFKSNITAIVTDVLPNGHLVVAGEKQVGVNRSVDVLRFSGIVDPRRLAPGSVIDSPVRGQRARDLARHGRAGRGAGHGLAGTGVQHGHAVLTQVCTAPMHTLRTLLQRSAALVLVMCCGLAGAADFRDPVGQPFLVWPTFRSCAPPIWANTSTIASCLQTCTPARVIRPRCYAALQAVDSLQAHHERTALAQLGRTLNTQLIGELDRQARRINTRSPKAALRVCRHHARRVAARLCGRCPGAGYPSRPRQGRVALVAYITYTRLEGSLVQATATLVKLGSGESQSFTVTVPAPTLADALARDIFDYFQGTRFSQHQNPLAAREWLMAAPGHADQLVSREAAQRYCQSQNAALPTAGELETAEASGFLWRRRGAAAHRRLPHPVGSVRHGTGAGRQGARQPHCQRAQWPLLLHTQPGGHQGGQGAQVRRARR